MLDTNRLRRPEASTALSYASAVAGSIAPESTASASNELNSKTDPSTASGPKVSQVSYSKQDKGSAPESGKTQDPKDTPKGADTPPMLEAVEPPAKTEEFDVTLNQAIFAGLNGYPVIGAELDRIQLAQADYLTATLFPNPDLFTNVQLLPLTRPYTRVAQGGPPQQDTILTYPIDWFRFGKRTAQISREHFGVHVAQTEFENLIRLRVVITACARDLIGVAGGGFRTASRVIGAWIGF